MQGKTLALIITGLIGGILIVCSCIFVIFILIPKNFTNKTEEKTPTTSTKTTTTYPTQAPIEQSSIILSEAFTDGWLGYYYPTSSDSSNVTLHYTLTNTVNWTTMKPVSSARIENITINPGISGYKMKVIPLSHVKQDDFPDGVPLADMFADGLVFYRDKLNSVPDAGTSFDIKISDKEFMPEYLDEVTKTAGYFLFKIKMYDFSSFKTDLLQENGTTKGTVGKILSAAGLQEGDLSTEVNYDLVLKFEDGTTETKHIKVNVDGTQHTDYSITKQNYVK